MESQIFEWDTLNLPVWLKEVNRMAKVAYRLPVVEQCCISVDVNHDIRDLADKQSSR